MSNACSFPHNFYPAYITNWSFILGIENCSKMVTLWPPINTHTHKTIVHFIVSFIILLASYLFFHHLPMQMIFTVSQTLFYNIICITQLMNQPWSFWCQIYKQKQTCTNKKNIYIYILCFTIQNQFLLPSTPFSSSFNTSQNSGNRTKLNFSN